MSTAAKAARTAAENEPSGVKLALTLGLAGLLSGVALAGVYEITLPRIQANQAAATRAAVLKVVPGSQAIQRLVWRSGRFEPAGEGASDAPGVFAAYAAGGQFVGYAIEGEGAGFQDAISLLFGYDPARKRIVGMHVLESRETPGLGDKIYKDQGFLTSFADLAATPAVQLVKKGERSRPNEVDAITGATVSSKAVVSIINQACQDWLSRLPSSGSEPPLQQRSKSSKTRTQVRP